MAELVKERKNQEEGVREAGTGLDSFLSSPDPPYVVSGHKGSDRAKKFDFLIFFSSLLKFLRL